ncbi:ABC transporter ATP-binding protein [Tenacibaculum retecalamus]|uniref:ABC transporter ATP-binding protein n=1 Tax=Tenacibaculum retecalamus TaxID=3018315 RepID=UPI0023D94B98|nr:ABC transporter ATP-binding protein [Tenacibaculum retecalamus]WBX71209.1 ABC transporter ATP-binding protein [Tenacibaculum retecalamus]
MIQVTNLSKSFDQLQAVQNLSFSIKKGEVFGLLDPNGAGKSTTINIMSTILSSDKGKILIDGNDIKKTPNFCKTLIGVVPQEVSLYNEFTAYQNLLFWGKLYKIPTQELKEKVTAVLELIGLSDRKDDLIKTFSGGMKRRINIASAILHNPKVLFMDEPTVGVDPQSRNRIFEIIENLNNQGMTIVYTTHYMEEVERLCNRIAIIDNGKIVAQGTQSELQKESNVKETIEITYQSILANQKKSLLENFQKITFKEKSFVIVCDVNKDLVNIISICNAQKISIEDLKLNKVTLESIFLKLTGKQLRD